MSLDHLTFSLLRSIASRDWLQPALNRALAPFNPFDQRRYKDPYPLYDRARTEPIFFHKAAQTWIVTGYDEAEEVLRGPVSVDRSHIEGISPYNKMRQENVDLMMATMLMRDAPDHGRLRRLVNRAFSRRAIVDLEPQISILTDELVDQLRMSGPTVDIMSEFANRLPVYVIAELLGIPKDQRDELKEMSEVVSQFVDPFLMFDPVEMDETIDNLRLMFNDLAAKRLAEPADDLLTALVQVEDDGDRLDRNELISMALLLLIGGHETTSSLIGNSIVALSRHPGASKKLDSNPALNRNAIEEFLRYDSPVQATDRTVVSEFTIGDKILPVGAIVLVLFGAANRDPRRYDNADQLQLDRENPRPISFGHGVHHCIGAALARMETAAAITTFVNAFPDFEVDETKLEWRHSNTFRGPKTVPVRLNQPAVAAVAG
ncbi:MAG: cytochrome P450 [Acidimicrobiales bacterium]